MKTKSFKLLLAAVIVTSIMLINTGCPRSANLSISKDSTEGNPPKIKRGTTFHPKDSTEGNPPKLQSKPALHKGDSTEGNPPQ